MQTSRLAPLMSSAKADWCTPPWLIELLGPFDVDLFASKENSVATYYSDDFFGDAASGELGRYDLAWGNPPYQRTKPTTWDFVKGVHDLYYPDRKSAYNLDYAPWKTTLLLPSRTDTKGFHNYILDKATIHFVKGRLKFVGAKDAAPFPSMVVVYDYKLPGGEGIGRSIDASKENWV